MLGLSLFSEPKPKPTKATGLRAALRSRGGAATLPPTPLEAEKAAVEPAPVRARTTATDITQSAVSAFQTSLKTLGSSAKSLGEQAKTLMDVERLRELQKLLEAQARAESEKK